MVKFTENKKKHNTHHIEHNHVSMEINETTHKGLIKEENEKE